MRTGRPAILTPVMAQDIIDSRSRQRPETFDSIANRFGISTSTVTRFYYRTLRKCNIDLRRVMTNDDKATIDRLYSEGKRSIAISTATGFTRYRIEKYLGILSTNRVPEEKPETNILCRKWA